MVSLRVVKEDWLSDEAVLVQERLLFRVAEMWVGVLRAGMLRLTCGTRANDVRLMAGAELQGCRDRPKTSSVEGTHVCGVGAAVPQEEAFGRCAMRDALLAASGSFWSALELRRLHAGRLRRLRASRTPSAMGVCHFAGPNGREEAYAARRGNVALLAAVEECQLRLREWRQGRRKGEQQQSNLLLVPSCTLLKKDDSSAVGGVASFLARCSFAEARRNRLRREVKELSEACDRERAVHASLLTESRRISSLAERVFCKRHLLMSESEVTTDLAQEERANASVTLTMQAVLSLQTGVSRTL
ncbi:uncharacterized protein Tco025E_08804 [Trypanosoma conorhini]|uniref:Uncharacterized protein n=1 Tax=Trypanosoma conorhini TaxID=83891 RepID=A0A422N4N1_9TRYP|nr:uncharacterized protein Tco025E_08804 [Trypanosoma conorhini]RNF00437.1 hypothetical protein Tco025E_08804 [Trypanosoma conorhini]